MATIKLTIEYDGTMYAGWQRQPNDLTIQAVLEEALFKITQQHISAVGAGRTDSGVHALGQVVSFQSDKLLDSAQWAPALNNYLPKDISVTLQRTGSPDDFHARFNAKGKIYEYRITTQPSRLALNRDRVWHFPHQLWISMPCAKPFNNFWVRMISLHFAANDRKLSTPCAPFHIFLLARESPFIHYSH